EMGWLGGRGRGVPDPDQGPAEGLEGKRGAIAERHPRREGRLVQESEDQRGSHVRRLCPQRGPVRQALRQGRQSIGAAAMGQAGAARELAPAPGTGGPALNGPFRVAKSGNAKSKPPSDQAPGRFFVHATSAPPPPPT